MIDITDSKQLNTHFNNKFPDEILAHLSAYLRTPNPNQSLMKDIESYSITRTFLKKMDSYRGLYQGTFKGQTIEKQEEEQEEDQQRRRGRNRFWASNTIEERGYYIKYYIEILLIEEEEEDYFDIEVYYGQKYLDRKYEIDFLVQTGQITEEEEYQERKYIKKLYFFNLLRHVCNNLLFEKEEGAKYMKHFYENDRKYFKNVMNAITRDRRNQNRY